MTIKIGMPRQARLDFPGTLHHAICRGIEKQEIVTDDRNGDNFVTHLEQSASTSRTVIYAWALMTNHTHILLRSVPEGESVRVSGSPRSGAEG